MLGRILITALAFAFGAAMPLGAVMADQKDQAVVRDEDLAISSDDEDDGDGPARLAADTHSNDSDSFTSGVDSNDRTNSRVTPVTRDRDRSRGDLTRDRTDDGPGPKKRDWTENKTNDRSRRDTR